MRSDAVAERYDRLANSYEARWRHYVHASVRETLARLPLAPGLRILDVGCGTGRLLGEARRLEPDTRLVGVDLSREMLRAAQRSLAPSTALARADVHALPFADGSFDVVVSSSAFHYWIEPREAVAELARVLRPGGQLVLTDWCDDFLACRICDRLLRLFSRAHQRIVGSGECRRLLEESGYRVDSIDRYKIDWLWGLMTARAVSPRTHDG